MTASSNSTPTRPRKALRTVAIILAVPVTIFALVLAATPFSQVARGVMFSFVFWDHGDIDHIHVFPARDIPTSTASELPRRFDDTTVEAFSTIDIREYLVDQPFLPEPIALGSRTALDQFMADSDSTAFLVVKDGVLVHEWYAEDIDPDALHTSFSVSKSIISTVVGMAVTDGSISSLDDPITVYVPELLKKDPRFAAITLRHLITMTSGLKYEESMLPYGDPANTYYSTDLRRSALNAVIVDEPGKNFLYNNYNPLLLGMAVERATGQKIGDYMSDVLWAPMGAEADASWSMDSFYNGFEKLESGFNARPIDFARFGLMFANGGTVDGVQVVPLDWVKEATAPTNVSVGQDYLLEKNFQYMWHVYADNRFAAEGANGQLIVISPDESTVIVRLGRSESLMWPMLLLDLTKQLNDKPITTG